MTEKINKSFLGRGWSFPPTFVKGFDIVEMAEEEEDIRQGLNILLNTAVGERFLKPDYGCDLKDHLFNAMNNSIDSYIKDLIITAVLYHEPRIDIEDVGLKKDINESRILITLTYIVRSTNARYNRVYPFYTTEGTEL